MTEEGKQNLTLEEFDETNKRIDFLKSTILKKEEMERRMCKELQYILDLKKEENYELTKRIEMVDEKTSVPVKQKTEENIEVNGEEIVESDEEESRNL